MVQAPAGGGSSGFTAANKPTPDVVTGTPPPTKSVKVTPNQHNAPLSARISAPLDLKTVERRGQPTQAKDPGPKHTRLHDIPDAPTYRPTEEEFKDPMEYMNKIAPEGRKYGIVKIVPPTSWNPEFGIDTTRFHFRVRKQELNSVEGGTRANNNYLDQLAKFHKQNGSTLHRFPSVDKRPLDLYKLKKAVEARGGFEAVCKLKKWAEIGRDLGYSGKIMSSLSTSLKNSYQRYLEPYEEYLRIVKPGVQQQLELENGGPYTPSPGTSPFKRPVSEQNTPGDHPDESATLRASVALHAQVNGHGPTESTPAPAPRQPSPPARSGFTPVNPGGFTAVNAQPTSTGFTSVNGAASHEPAVPKVDQGTPARAQDVVSGSANSTPSFRPVNGEPNPMKRALAASDGTAVDTDIEASGRKSKRVRKDGPPTVVGSNMHQPRSTTPRFTSARDRTNQKPGDVCERCGLPDKANTMLLCESCDCGYHMACLEPPLSVKPDEWNCPRCLVGTAEYGFEDGEIYSLKEFQEKAARFKAHHFAEKTKYDPVTNSRRPVTEDDTEREFWRLVENVQETVEVEYGADIHSTTHGSGFPTIERQPRDPYSTDPWNLNVMPLYGESLFRHIKSDISGMTVPWLYVGMVFSTFCWHNEDHYAYSANYQHFGDTKTWYGIPGEDAERFETAMREAVPELFEGQPDLLFQLVTLMPPEKLRKAGVRVYAIDQRAGEFVITFPQAYHAGFNHGFNVNEAVNFAPSDWEPFGEAGVERLQTYRRQACFSHDELLMTAATHAPPIKTCRWLAPALERMLDKELALRNRFLTGPNQSTEADGGDVYRGPRYPTDPVLQESDLDEEEQYICAFCKAYCYLSRLLCTRSGKPVCPLHAGAYECCDMTEEQRYSNDNQEHPFYIRHTDDQLRNAVQKVVDKARAPEAWAQKVEAAILDEPRPQLKTLRSLLTEGEKIPYELPQLAEFKKFVERCNEWVEEATNYITRKQGRRKSEKNGRKSFAKAAELEEQAKEYRRVENIRKLLQDADEICFDCPEIETLRERAENIAQFQDDARQALATRVLKSTQEYEDLCEIGRGYNVDLPEIEQLERLIDRLKWRDQAREKRGKPQSLQDVSDFIKRGLVMGLHETDPDLHFYKEMQNQGQVWEAKAKEVMSVEHVHYQQLDALSKQASTLPVNPETLAQVEAILKKQREAQEKILNLYEQSKDPDPTKRPMYGEVRDVIAALEELNNKPAGTLDLEKEMRRHEDWMRSGKKLFGKTNAPLHILHQHMQIVRDRNKGCFSLRDKPRMPVEPSSRRHSAEPGVEVDGPDMSDHYPDVFCICRKPEAGMMIECELCHEWYHGKCLKIARGKVKEEDKYTCPICDWRLKIPRDAARPKLEDLQKWQADIPNLPFQADEEDTLAEIIDTAQAFRWHIEPYINPVAVTPEEIGTLRFYLRKVEGADVLLAEETNFLRQELHKWAPVAPTAPPIIEASSSTRKPRPTKQQKEMKRLGITNPDELPPEYKMKPTKRKVMETLERQRQNQPLQPAGSPANAQSRPSQGPDTPGTQQTPGPKQQTPAFSYDTQPTSRPGMSSGYRDSPLFAHSPFAQGPSHATPSAGTPGVSYPTNTSPAPQPASFSGGNIDPALFGPPSSTSAAGAGGLSSPSAKDVDKMFSEMVNHEDGEERTEKEDQQSMDALLNA